MFLVVNLLDKLVLPVLLQQRLWQMYLVVLFHFKAKLVQGRLLTPMYPISRCTIPIMPNLLDPVEVEVSFRNSSPTSPRRRLRPQLFLKPVDLLSFVLPLLPMEPMANRLDSPIPHMLFLLMTPLSFTTYPKKDPARLSSPNLVVVVVVNLLESMSSTVTTSYERVNQQYIKMDRVLPLVWVVLEQ
jgi:hypothetical protein